MGPDGTLPAALDLAGGSRSAADPVIRVEGVSVRFRVPLEPIRSFKEYAIRRVRGRLDFREVWALKDVSFEVGRGEVLGIIGRNGSGKSTLLKVIARVLRPTSGRVWVKGWVAPLLELGGGFHPELTGRENVYLNGTLLGRTRREIAERFDWIVDFAELWDFIDAPLRTYSTGLVARLGFAVATAWEPEVLLVDEVLAVGDEAFQRKCFARLNSFRSHGATVIIVSHNVDMLANLCEQVLWLDRGTVCAIGKATSLVKQYHDALG